MTPSRIHSAGLAAASALAFAVLVGCTTGPTIRSHADPGFNYDAYDSFALMTPSPGSLSRNAAATPGLSRQLREETEAAFVAKGLTKVPAAGADLLILVHAGVEEKISVTDWGMGYPRLRGGAYDIDQYKAGTVRIDVFDAKSRDLVWRGTAEAEVGGEPDPVKMKNTIEAIVVRYPN